MVLRHLLLLTIALSLSVAPRAQQETVIVIHDVTVVDLTEGVLVPGQTVLVVGTRIRAIGHTDSVAVPPDADVLDGSGGYLIPGLVDAHVHLFNNVSRRPPNAWALPLFVAHGVTGVREMWTETASLAEVGAWRRDVEDGVLVAPRVLAAGALVEGTGVRTPNMPTVDTADEGRQFVRAASEEGFDFVKVYSHLAPDVYAAIVDEARAVGLPVDGHVPLRVRATEAARAGQRTNEHLQQVREACTPIEDRLMEERETFYDRPYDEEAEWPFLDAQVHRTAAEFDEPTCVRVAGALAEAGQWQVPTLVNERRWFLGAPPGWDRPSRAAVLPASERDAWERSAARGGETYEGDSLSLQRGWAATLHVVGVLGRVGANILVGTDFGAPFVFPGASVHEEMGLLVQSGLTPLQALRAATINPARALGLADALGTVEAGKLADLVLLDANPLDRISNTRAIRAVVLGGRVLQRPDLDALLGEIDPSSERRR